MTGWTLRLALVLAVALVGAIAMLPLSVAIQRSPVMPGLTHGQVQGTLWHGRISGLAYGRQPIGAAELKLQPAQLLRGEFVYSMRLAGPSGRGNGEIFAGRGYQGVRHLDFTADVSQFVGLSDEVRRAGGWLRAQGLAIELHAGDCRSASGTLGTDVLVRLGQQYGETLPRLAGTLSCRHGMAEIALDGESETGVAIAVRSQIGTKAPSTLSARISGAGPELSRALAALGFNAEAGNYVYQRETSLAGGAP